MLYYTRKRWHQDTKRWNKSFKYLTELCGWPIYRQCESWPRGRSPRGHVRDRWAMASTSVHTGFSFHHSWASALWSLHHSYLDSRILDLLNVDSTLTFQFNFQVSFSFVMTYESYDSWNVSLKNLSRNLGFNLCAQMKLTIAQTRRVNLMAIVHKMNIY